MSFFTAGIRRTLQVSVVVVLTVFASPALTSCGPSAAGVYDVVVAPAHFGTLAVTATGHGTLESASDIPVTLGFRGTITGVLVHAGDAVRANQAVLTVTSSGSDNAAGKLGLRIASLTRELKGLSAQGPGQAAAAATVRSQLALSREAYAVALAGRGLLRAPVGGVVDAVAVVPGERVVSDQPLLHIVDRQHLVVDAALSTEFIGLIGDNSQATFRIPGVSAVPLRAHVVSIAPVARDASTVDVQLAVDTPAPAAVPGTPVIIVLATRSRPSVEVNRLAVLQSDTAPTVFMVEGQTVRQRSVVVGVSDGTTTQVLSGLAAGDTVVIAGAQPLTDGSSVRIIPPQGQ